MGIQDDHMQFWLEMRDTKPFRCKGAPTTVGVDGYILEWCPTHPQAIKGTVLQHRLVMEEHLGRFLGRLERVHHRDSCRMNNELSNLELCTSADHMRKHWSTKGRRDPALIQRVREFASDHSKTMNQTGLSATTVRAICKENNIHWENHGKNSKTLRLTEEKARAALKGRTTREAAEILGCSFATMHNKFSHLLTKRASPGFLDPVAEQIWDEHYKQRIPMRELEEKYHASAPAIRHALRKLKGHLPSLPHGPSGASARQPPGRKRRIS